MTELPVGITLIQLIAGVVITILTTLGVGAIILAALQRRWKQSDEKTAAHVTLDAKQIDQDVNAFNEISRRLTKFEERFDVVSTQLTEQKVENAKLEGANENLVKDNNRLEGELGRVRERVHTLSGEIGKRDLQIAELNQLVNQRQGEIIDLHKDMLKMMQDITEVKLAIQTFHPSAPQFPSSSSQ